MMRRGNLVKFATTSFCYYLGRYGTMEAVLDSGVIGILLSDSQTGLEILVGTDIYVGIDPLDIEIV